MVGRERFAQISAVEGIALTDEMRATFEQFDRQGLSAEERRPSALRPAALTGFMYDSGPDPYCYPDTTILKNRLGLRDQAQLDALETLITAQRGEEPLPRGRLGTVHYRAIHRHLFQDVFDWAGRWRIAKGSSMFCYPEHIDAEMRKLFERLAGEGFLQGLSAVAFANQTAHVLAELNAIHPFREGNGRTQLTYLTLLAARAGHPLALERMDPSAILAAMVDSFKADERPLAALIGGLI